LFSPRSILSGPAASRNFRPRRSRFTWTGATETCSRGGAGAPGRGPAPGLRPSPRSRCSAGSLMPASRLSDETQGKTSQNQPYGGDQDDHEFAGQRIHARKGLLFSTAAAWPAPPNDLHPPGQAQPRPPSASAGGVPRAAERRPVAVLPVEPGPSWLPHARVPQVHRRPHRLHEAPAAALVGDRATCYREREARPSPCRRMACPWCAGGREARDPARPDSPPPGPGSSRPIVDGLGPSAPAGTARTRTLGLPVRRQASTIVEDYIRDFLGHPGRRSFVGRRCVAAANW